MEPSQKITRLWLIRHGQPQAEVKGRCYGSLDVGLSSDGKRQIEGVAVRLADWPLGAVYSSPRRRAVESAHLIAAGHLLQTTTLEALSEINFGSFEGLSYEEIERRYPALYRKWMESPTEVEFPDGDSFAVMRRRVIEAVERLRQEHCGESIALVSHGGVNRILLAEALGIPPARIFRIGQRYAAVNRIDYFGEEPLVEIINGCWSYPFSRRKG